MSFDLLSLSMYLPDKFLTFFTVLLENLFYMITCKSFWIFYEPDDARWISSENLFILINKNNFLEKETFRIIVYIKFSNSSKSGDA